MYAGFRGLGKRILIFIMMVLGVGVLGITALLCYSVAAAQQIVINEVCSNNFTVICDENRRYSDYVELYNPAPVPVSLSGFSISDNIQERDERLLNTIIIGPRDYYLVWIDGSDNDMAAHADFKISRDGETVYLSNASGEIIDSVEVPPLDYNTVFARVEDGALIWERMEATAGKSNNGARVFPSAELDVPLFSATSGFYENEFDLEITAGEGETVYYTLDGSDPTVDSVRYRGPIRIKDPGENENVYAARTDLSTVSDYVPPFKVDKAVVVRAIACNESGTVVSKPHTETYFINYEAKVEYKGLPIVSLVVNPANLFDDAKGIYVNGETLEEYKKIGEGDRYDASNAFNRGKEWEREALLQYFDAEHELRLAQGVGIRIAGQSTRTAIQKSLNVYARDIYDSENQFAYDFFENMTYSSVKLRNGGSDHAGSKILDPFLQELVAQRDVSTQASFPCVVFLNGEYWGIYNLRERYKEEYFENHYGISKKNVWMIDAGAESIGGYLAWTEYDSLLNQVSQMDMTIPDNYDWICAKIDIQSLIDIYVVNLFIQNGDVGFDKNMAVWRCGQVQEGEYGDTRWRFMLYDLDAALSGYDINTFEISEWWKEDFNLMDEVLISRLMENEDFKKQFCLSFMDMVNTVFSYERVHEELERWRTIYQEQVIKSHQRFVDADIGEEFFSERIEHMDTFFAKRPDYITKYLAQELSLTGNPEPVNIEIIQPEGGIVEINTAVIHPEGEWVGYYYTDYPVTLTAIANPGYEFVGWSGDIQSAEEQITARIPSGGITLRAEFIREE